MKEFNLLISLCGKFSTFKYKNPQNSTAICRVSSQYESMAYFLIIFSLFLILPHIAFAGTGGEELKTLYEKTVALVEGWGGKFIAAFAFITGIIAALVRSSLIPLIPGFGIAILVGVGPSIFTSGVTAII
ncbi:MAG: hypothetical protein ACJAVG_001315 [Rickettsiales bacterium]|jgi:hypothetical protein